MNFIGKEGHPTIQPSTTPEIELGTSGLGGRDLNHCINPSSDMEYSYHKQRKPRNNSDRKLDNKLSLLDDFRILLLMKLVCQQEKYTFSVTYF